jgi:hypothetical protein
MLNLRIGWAGVFRTHGSFSADVGRDVCGGTDGVVRLKGGNGE